jgi:hypothetical protein
MAARKLRLTHSEDVRKKIQCTQLINRLMGHIDGKVSLAPTQIRSIEILLNKSLPNLSDVRMDMTGNSVTFNLNLSDVDGDK